MAQHVVLGIGWLAPLLFAASVRADCTRPVEVPVAPTGLSVIVNAGTVSGIYPELLRALGPRIGCDFRFNVVPRARLQAMFEDGRADLLLPATRTPRREQFGYFVPLTVTRPTLLSIDARRAPLRSMQALLERRELRVALVRGFDYGDAYQAMIGELTAQKRVFFEADVVGVARLLQAGYADLTIMGPNIFVGAIQGDARVEGLARKLRIEPIEELPWSESGLYISKSAVNAPDRALIEQALLAAAKAGAMWDAYKRYYSAEVLADSVRPR